MASRGALLAKISRPRPIHIGGYHAAEELQAWARSTFIEGDGLLCNPEHAHLRHATVGFLWAGDLNERGGRRILGTAQIGKPNASDPWSRGQREQQIEEWFGDIPDFIITIDAGYWGIADDAQACALIEHELYHCAQAADEFGMPRFNRDGVPIWKIRPHDIEEFVGVVARYGAEATYSEAMRKAFEHGPTITAANVAAACGTCRPK